MPYLDCIGLRTPEEEKHSLLLSTIYLMYSYQIYPLEAAQEVFLSVPCTTLDTTLA